MNYTNDVKITNNNEHGLNGKNVINYDIFANWDLNTHSKGSTKITLHAKMNWTNDNFFFS